MIGRPSMDEVLQLTAGVMALRGTCPTSLVGAVFALDGRILATGYNGAPTGSPHCTHAAQDSPCRTAVHAEANGLAFAARYGVRLDGATVYCTLSPCPTCARLLVNAGIARFVTSSLYREHDGIDVLRASGVAFDWVPLVGELRERL